MWTNVNIKKERTGLGCVGGGAQIKLRSELGPAVAEKTMIEKFCLLKLPMDMTSFMNGPKKR